MVELCASCEVVGRPACNDCVSAASLVDVVPHMVAQLERDLAKLPRGYPRDRSRGQTSEQLFVHLVRCAIRSYRDLEPERITTDTER